MEIFFIVLNQYLVLTTMIAIFYLFLFLLYSKLSDGSGFQNPSVFCILMLIILCYCYLRSRDYKI